MEYSFDINSEQENRDSIKMRISVFVWLFFFNYYYRFRGLFRKACRGSRS